MAGNIPYIGSKISLITTSDIRYEGILYTLNREESTIAVQHVRSFGTEGRRTPEVPMSNEIYDFIIFRGKDLKDLTVIQATQERPSPSAYGPGGSAGEYGDSHGAGLYGQAADHYGGGLHAGAGAAQASSMPSAYGRPGAVASVPPRNGFSAAAAPPAGLGGPVASAYAGAAYASPASSASRPVESKPPSVAVPSPYGGVPPAAVSASRSPYPSVAEPLAPSMTAGVPRAAPGLGGYGAEDVVAAMPVQRGTAQEASAEARSSAEAKERQLAAAAATEPKAGVQDAAGAGRGRGKGGPPQKKSLFDVLRFHPRAEELIKTKMRGQNSANLQPSDLRAMSELNQTVYHFYVDYGNFCCHMAQSDEQQWESLSKALKKHFEKEFGTGQSQKPPAPQRPNNTLGDFITIETKASKKTSKIPARGGGRTGRGAGRGDKKDDPNSGEFEAPGSVEDLGGSQSASWVCPRCTLRNENLLLECAACGTSKQQAALWAEFPPLG